MWFLDLLGLLFHTTVDRKGISADTISLATHAVDKSLCECYCNFGQKTFPCPYNYKSC